MVDLSKFEAIAPEFGMVDVGPGGNGDDQEMPARFAWRVLPVIELRAKLATAVLHVAQTHAAQAYAARDKQVVESMARITDEIIDDLCPPLPPRWPGPRPHPWWWVIRQLGDLADQYPAESLLRTAAFDLAQRIVTRARDLRPLDRSRAAERAEQVTLCEAK